MLIFERAKEIPLFNFNFVVEKFTAVRYNKYKGSSRKLFGKLEFDGGNKNDYDFYSKRIAGHYGCGPSRKCLSDFIS